MRSLNIIVPVQAIRYWAGRNVGCELMLMTPQHTVAAYRHEFYMETRMDKIRNGDAVLYKNRRGTIYGKPRENKYKGLLYTVKIGDDYVKASASELSPSQDEINQTTGPQFNP